MRILILDNYDSFTYNLYQELGEVLLACGEKFVLDVIRNDKITLQEIKKRKDDVIFLSPGPGDPSDRHYFGVCADVITELAAKTKVVGVCLGMQGIAHYCGGKVVRAKVPMHGKTSPITHDGKGMFKGLPQGLEVMRYHSLVVDESTLPKDLVVTARVGLPSVASGGAGEIMGLRHKKLKLEGIQFHPESFGTEAGKLMLQNAITL